MLKTSGTVFTAVNTHGVNKSPSATEKVCANSVARWRNMIKQCFQSCESVCDQNNK